MKFVAIFALAMLGCAWAACPHSRFVKKHLCTGGSGCGDTDAAQQGATGKTATRNKDNSLLCKGKPCPTNTVLVG